MSRKRDIVFVREYRGVVKTKPSWSKFTYTTPETIAVSTLATSMNAAEVGARALNFVELRNRPSATAQAYCLQHHCKISADPLKYSRPGRSRYVTDGAAGLMRLLAEARSTSKCSRAVAIGCTWRSCGTRLSSVMHSMPRSRCAHYALRTSGNFRRRRLQYRLYHRQIGRAAQIRIPLSRSTPFLAAGITLRARRTRSRKCTCSRSRTCRSTRRPSKWPTHGNPK